MRSIIYFLLIVLIGCNKYLEVRPDDTLVVPESLADLQALLDNSSNMNKGRTPNFGECSGDDFFLLGETYDALDVEQQRIYTWSIDKYNFQNDWSTAYEPIYVSNLCLELLNAIEPTVTNKAAWGNVKGSALFYRSYYFLNLLWVYAKAFDPQTANEDMGIILRLGSDFNVPSVRSTVRECYEKIVADTKEAAAWLPDQPTHVMRPSKAAAYGLLARTYLSMRIYDSAYHYADAALNLNNALMNFNGDNDINGSIREPIPFRLFNKEVIFYTEMGTTYTIILPIQAKIDTMIYKSYHEDDLRKIAFFEPSNNYYQFKGSYTGDEWQLFTGIASDELYLIRAEGNARAGRITEALQDLRTLLLSRWKNTAPPPSLSANNVDEAIKLILQERRKELLMRGLRWMDIKRLNKEGRNINLARTMGDQRFSLVPNSPYFALPLPADIIEQTGIPQNPK